MVAYSFKRRFGASIREGHKTQTIRAERKRHARPGENVQLYCGMRTRHCFLIGCAVCLDVMPIAIDFDWEKIAIGPHEFAKPHELDGFARADGFEDWADMRRFWFAEHDAIVRWRGVLIRWKDFTAGEGIDDARW